MSMTLAPNCCKRIRGHLKLVKEKSRLRTSGGEEFLVASVVQVLEVYRKVLGDKSVSSELTERFRQHIEPSLSKVWTINELVSYSNELKRFGLSLENILRKRVVQYCKSQEANEESNESTREA